MRNTAALYSIVMLSIFICMISCVKDVDLEQVESRSNINVFKTNIISFDKPVSAFYDINAVKIIVSDTINIGYVIGKYEDNLIKTDFLIEVTNSTNRAYQVEFDFLNKDHELQYSISFDVSASHNNRDIVFEYDEVFEGMELELVKATNFIIPKLNLLPSEGSTLDDSRGKLKLKSGTSLYYRRDSSK